MWGKASGKPIAMIGVAPLLSASPSCAPAFYTPILEWNVLWKETFHLMLNNDDFPTPSSGRFSSHYTTQHITSDRKKSTSWLLPTCKFVIVKLRQSLWKMQVNN
jgi:hypothetical protein